MHETIYEDSEGRSILVIKLLDAYGMVNKLSQPTWFVDSKLNPIQRTWVGLTELEKAEITSLKWWDWEDTFDIDGFIKAIEAKLKEKNV
jgi:hypothetical protein